MRNTSAFFRSVLFCLALFAGFAAAQNPSQPISPADSARAKMSDSCSMQISLLTCAPGDDVYSIFGHTAIRVQDPVRGMDIVYNYGTFDDSDPLFYIHFTNGIMRYSLAAQTMPDFMAEYEYEHRAVQAQLLNLTCAQKRKLYNALRENTLEENRFYNYDFYRDNCTTRAGKIIAAQDSPVSYRRILPDPGPSYRDMFHIYLDSMQKSWAAFGIDLLLGAHLDNKASNEGAIYFLPDYLLNGMDHATGANGPLVTGKKTILGFPPERVPREWFTPTLLFSVIALVILVMSLQPGMSGGSFLRFFDPVFFAFIGLLGMLMAYVWIFRIDDVCRDNMNLLWAWPVHFITAFFFRRRPSWFRVYFRTAASMTLVLLAGYAFWHQQMAKAAIPLMLIIIVRSFFIAKNAAHVSSVPGEAGGPAATSAEI